MARKKTVKENNSIDNVIVEIKDAIVNEEIKEEQKIEETEETEIEVDIVEEIKIESEPIIEEIIEETPIIKEKITETVTEQPKEENVKRPFNRYSFGYIWNGQEFEF